MGSRSIFMLLLHCHRFLVSVHDRLSELAERVRGVGAGTAMAVLDFSVSYFFVWKTLRRRLSCAAR